jgi:ribosome biogenesis GTPase
MLPLSLMRGRVYKSTGSWYEVKTEDGRLIYCRIKGKLRLAGSKSTNPVAVGDYVDLAIQPDGEGLIKSVEDRKNHIVRRSVNLAKQTQVIASNLDQAVLVVTLAYPVTFPRFIDRFLVTAEAYDIPAVLVFNKVDLYDEETLSDLAFYTRVYLDAGYKVLHTSATQDIGLEDFKEMLRNKTSLISGHSGVGKSTLINCVEPDLDLKTTEVSQTHRQGQHTTTFAEMYDLGFGGSIIDTPGIRGFGLVNMRKEEIGDYFPEILRLKENCRFSNCLHLEEPGCAVKKALENHELAFTRYESYLSFIKGDHDEEPYRSSAHDRE